jgi:hypothetical protein
VIFVHGHAFNDQSSPENSIAIFNKMQEKMKNEGYISMGQLDLQKTDSNSENMWASYFLAPTTKASYYYITHYTLAGYDVSIKNQDGIENYAIRLKEIVDEVKTRTGNDKVTIVSHSMGGLVAREYIHLFGEESVDKIITINTPHKGVSGRTQDYCTFFGAKKECEDLSQGSILLDRLNSPKNKVNIPIYAIRTTGCIMDNGEIGDGVVTNTSAMLENAINIEIKGNCTDSLQSDLHNNALDPDKYPQVYEKVIEILNE